MNGHQFSELNVDLNRNYMAANDDLLDSALFPSFESDTVEMDQSLEKMQADDPLATQIWKFFTKTKQQLPNQQRMENLTWRMMALNMRKKKQEEEEKKRQQDINNRYVMFVHFYSLSCAVGL